MKPPVLLALAGATLISITSARADHKVYSPYVEQGIFELETRGHRTVDPSPEKNNQQTNLVELGYGVNSWWHTGFYGVMSKEPQSHFEYGGRWENIFQLTEQGKYWADFGVYLEYERNAPTQPGEIETKLLIQKNDVGPFVAIANIIFNREIGHGAGKGLGFEYALGGYYPWRRDIQFGIEAFGAPGRLIGFDSLSAQQHQLGPVISGKFNIPGIPGALLYNVGYLFGVTPGTPKGTAKAILEYEVPF